MLAASGPFLTGSGIAFQQSANLATKSAIERLQSQYGLDQPVVMQLNSAGGSLAQLDRAADFESAGSGFESSRGRQLFPVSTPEFTPVQRNLATASRDNLGHRPASLGFNRLYLNFERHRSEKLHRGCFQRVHPA